MGQAAIYYAPQSVSLAHKLAKGQDGGFNKILCVSSISRKSEISDTKNCEGFSSLFVASFAFQSP